MTDNQSETGGIESRNLGDVEDVEGWTFFARRRFKLENVDNSERFEDGVHVVGREASSEPEDEYASVLIQDAFDGELWTLPQLRSDGGQCGSLPETSA
jgi:hypothetical protein